MNLVTHFQWRKLLFIPPIVLGVAVLVWQINNRTPPTKAERSEVIHSVRIIEASELNLVPRAEGYGAVKPAKVWTAVAQVAGRVVEMHPNLRNGEILPADEVLLRIDPVDYELNLAQAQTELAELEVREQNVRSSLVIEQRNLVLAQKDVERKLKLAQQGTASQSTVDEAERNMLGSRTAMQNQNNTLALIPTQRKLLQTRISQAERDLAHATIRGPFNLRIANLQIEQDQYVAKGQSLFEGDAVDRVEIVAQVAIASLRRLFIGRSGLDPSMDRLNERISEYVGFRPLVRLDLGNHIAEWEAEFVRFSDNVDAETRTMGVVVAVDKPFEKVKPGFRPPLSKGMFVQVVLRGRAQNGRVVVPRAAVRDGNIYLADAENRLRRRPVKVLFNQDKLSVISEGIAAGDRILVSDLVPAVDGMLLQPQIDLTLTAELSAAAGAQQ